MIIIYFLTVILVWIGIFLIISLNKYFKISTKISFKNLIPAILAISLGTYITYEHFQFQNNKALYKIGVTNRLKQIGLCPSNAGCKTWEEYTELIIKKYPYRGDNFYERTICWVEN